jgi:putative ATP-dependent endonuclease of OLD family
MAMMPNGLNRVALSVTYSWNVESKSFEPTWQFLDSNGQPLQGRRRSINASPFFNYLLFFWLGALRDADDEFSARSRHWGGLLRSIQIPPELEVEVKATLDALDGKLLAADPKFGQISETVGHATEIAAGEKPGGAKLRMLPLNVRDLVARAGIVLRNEDLRPWLPLDHHGQGLQSLSVIFLFQAAVMQKLSEEIEGAEAVFAIEEPEAHLHPQAARTLWTRIAALPGQKLVTTHSPYFVQNVPLHNLRITRFHNGSTEIAFLLRKVISDLPWTNDVEIFINGRGLTQFTKDQLSGCIASTLWFDEVLAKDLFGCLRKTAGITSIQEKMDKFRHTCRVLISETEETELSFLGRRIRGEIFFAREWILVEGVSEILLLQAIGRAFGYDLDQHGISVIDFQNNGNAGIYSALADGFGIPWQMATDGDAESEKFHAQLFKRGYCPDDFTNRVFTLLKGNDLEDQLLADGHEELLRMVLCDVGVGKAEKCSIEELKAFLKNRKTAYMANLAPKVAVDSTLAAKMPKPLVAIVKALKDKYYGQRV